MNRTDGAIHLSFSELNCRESTESIEFVEDYLLVIFIFKTTKNSCLQFYRFCRFSTIQLGKTRLADVKG